MRQDTIVISVAEEAGDKYTITLNADPECKVHVVLNGLLKAMESVDKDLCAWLRENRYNGLKSVPDEIWHTLQMQEIETPIVNEA